MPPEERSMDLPLDDVRSFLVSVCRMSSEDANIYLLGLRKVVITSREVTDEIHSLRQNTALSRLRRLAKNGYFEETPHKGSPRVGGRGHARKFRVIPLKDAMKDALSLYDKFKTAIEKFDEHLELASGDVKSEDDLWIVSPYKTALTSAINSVREAENSVKIYARDCTWLDNEELTSALNEANRKRIKLKVIAKYPPNLKTTKRKFDKTIFTTEIDGPPFLLIDDSVLFLAFRIGSMEARYVAIKTTNPYLVNNFVRLFESGLSKRRKK